MKNAPHFEPLYLPLSIDLQAREAFFAYYVDSKCWNVLKQYHHSKKPPEHMTLAIEAVSLAYLWHQVHSDIALAAARERYVAALRLTNKMLKSSKEVTKDATLLSSLLLDLFEKITDSEPRNDKSWLSHVNGAVALVRLRGLEQFQAPTDLHMLSLLHVNYIVSCVASGSPVPDEVDKIQAYVWRGLDPQDPRLQISDIMVRYANLRSKVRSGVLTSVESIEISKELDVTVKTLVLEMPPSWQWSSTILSQKSNWTYDLHFDTYSNPRVCQGLNFLRVLRILLNESLIEYYLNSPTSQNNMELIGAAQDIIKALAGDICASVSPYVDCGGVARQRLAVVQKTELQDQTLGHILDFDPGMAHQSHTPSHQLDCYTLIFPLYVAGRSKAAPELRLWVIQQLRYIGSHFNIRKAEVVAQILEQYLDVSPWEVFAILGSYAFAS